NDDGEEEQCGELSIMLPFSALEPFREALDSGLQSDQAAKHERWKIALSDRLVNADIELRSELATAKMKLRDLSRLKPGDIIPIEMSEEVTVKAKDTPIFSGLFGTHKGANAIRVLNPTTSNTQPEASQHE
ncbi:MAG: FliM/FliN family flagellar motor switch protein, partial [Pseudomonadota bacterium]